MKINLVKYKFYYIPICFALAMCLWTSGCKKQSNTPAPALPKISFWEVIDTTCGIGFSALDMESMAGLPVESRDYFYLESIVNTALENIPVQSVYTREEALAILKNIQATVVSARTLQIDYGGAFYACLRYKMFDCDINTFIFLTIARQLDLPVYATLMPIHIAVVWKDEQNEIYWETTQGRERSREYYINKYGLQDIAGKNSILTRLDEKELIAVAWYNIGKAYADDINDDWQAASYLLEAQKQNPKWFKPYSTLAFIYSRMNKFENVLYYCNKSLELFPNQTELYRLKGMAFVKEGCNTEAINAYQKYLKLLQPHQPDYHQIKKETEKEITFLR